MKALVTGATGFVGSHLVARLLRERWRVTCLIRRTSRLDALAGLHVETRVGDLDDPAALCRAAEGADVVFHVAGLTRACTAAEYLHVNAEGTRRLLEAVIGARAAARRFVYVSSLAAVGPARRRQAPDETTRPRPLDAYGRSKLAGERVVRAAGDRLPVTIVRPPAVYGPGDRNFLPLFRLAARRRVVPIIGRPSKQVTFVHASDLAEGLYRAAVTPAAVAQTYFLGSGTHTMGEFADALSAAMNVRLRRLRVPAVAAWLAGEVGQARWALTGKATILSRRKVRDMLQPRWTCCWDKARRELGYRERVKLSAGLRQTLDWYVAHRRVRLQSIYD